jgi:hypothetical protein
VRRRFALPLLALFAVPTAGCVMSVPMLNPKPNVDLEKRSASMHIEFAPAVEDKFKIPPQNGMGAIEVTDWHQSLKNGLINGFGEAYTVMNGAPTQLTLEMSEATPELTPAAVSGYYGVVAANAQVRYKARVVANSQVVCRSNGTVISKTAVNNAQQVKDAVRSAVESMYEVISKECFEHPAAAATTASAPKKML